MATHCSILAWRIPWTRGAWHEATHRVEKESDTTPAVDRSSSGLTEPHPTASRPVLWGGHYPMTFWIRVTLLIVLACFEK